MREGTIVISYVYVSNVTLAAIYTYLIYMSKVRRYYGFLVDMYMYFAETLVWEIWCHLPVRMIGNSTKIPQ